jgi:sucrose-6-phosphate hydrolase SacC (GH32 family)
VALEIIAEFAARDADEFGLKVRVGVAEETRIGYDSVEQEVFVDRSHSGNVNFSPRFDHRHAARAQLSQGKLRLRLFVDACSVEVFVDGGRAVLSDLIFTDSSSDGVAVFSAGESHVISLDVWTLHQSET